MASKSTSAYPVSPPRRTLKRSASNASLASLPTPPRTYRRRGRGRSRGSCDSDSDSDDAGRRRHTPEIPSADEGERAGKAEPKKKKRRVALEQDKDDEEAFWLGGITSQHDDEEQEQESDHGACREEDDGGKSSSKSSAATLKRQAPLLYRKLQASASSTSSQTEQGLLSPPASHRKPAAVTTLEVASKTTLSTIEELPVTPRKNKTKKAASPPALGLKAFVDSPSNPFLDTPVDPSLVLSDSDGEEVQADKEKEVPEYDKPTVTYVFRGVKRVYQNPMFDHAKGRPLTPPPNSKLPVDNPLYSPDPTCKPRLLFPEAHKRRNKVRAAKAAVGKQVKKKQTVAVDSDSDDGKLGESSKKIPQPKFVAKAKAKKAAAPAVVDDPFA